MDLLTGKVKDRERRRRGHNQQRQKSQWVQGNRFKQLQGAHTSSSLFRHVVREEELNSKSQARIMKYEEADEEGAQSEVPNIQTFVIDPTKLTLEMQKQIHNKKQLSDTKRSGYKPGRLVPGT